MGRPNSWVIQTFPKRRALGAHGEALMAPGSHWSTSGPAYRHDQRRRVQSELGDEEWTANSCGRSRASEDAAVTEPLVEISSPALDPTDQSVPNADT